MLKSVHSLNRTFEKTDQWLSELCGIASYENKELSYSVLRAVLHAIRDRLTIEQAAHFASELPLLVQGIYYENWNPAHVPEKMRTKEDFMKHIEHELGNAEAGINTEEAVHSVISLLKNHLSPGSVEKMQAQFPQGLQKFLH